MLSHVLDWGPGLRGEPWHVNDHCIVRDDAGIWHLFGIVSPDPGYPPPARWGLGHATATDLYGPWTKQAPSLEVEDSLGETVLWAPYVVRAGTTWHMFYCSGGPDWTDWGISAATSTDLWRWSRVGQPLFRDGYQARDPMLLWIEDCSTWVLYYTATEDRAGGRHVVAYRTSTNLGQWSDRNIAFASGSSGTEYGPTESPFVVARDGWFYLFVGPTPYDTPSDELPNWRHPGYSGTDVYRSRDWRRWTEDGKVAHLGVHAPEVVSAPDGRSIITHAGIAQGGLHLAELNWVPRRDARCTG